MDQEKREDLFRTYELMQGHREGIHEIFDWMRSAGFLDAPASTRFHGSYPGGLLEHSDHVYLRHFMLRALLPEEMQNQISDDTLFAVGFLHDLCKLEFYEAAKKPQKNAKTGKWEEVDTYTVNELFPFGHGEKSAMIASRYLKLSNLEALAIRWHMGGYRDGEQNAVVNVWKKHRDADIPPLVLLTHLADNIATYVDEGESWPAHCMITPSSGSWDIYHNMLPAVPDGISDEEHFKLLFNHFLSKREGADNLLKYILGKNSDFATAPASLMNYGAESGGLCNQTIRMFYKLVQVCDMLQFQTMRYTAKIPGGQPVSIKLPATLQAQAVTKVVNIRNGESIEKYELSSDDSGNLFVNIPEPAEEGKYAIFYTPSQETLMESIATAALLHGVGCINTYGFETRNRKNEAGEWEKYLFTISEEEIPWGSIGAKSVFMCQPFMRLLRDEALAIRWHEGPFDGVSGYACSKAFEISPLAFCTHIAFLLASYTKI